jgi:hypothetical protein
MAVPFYWNIHFALCFDSNSQHKSKIDKDLALL